MSRGAVRSIAVRAALRPLGTFPPTGPPRVVWLGLEQGARELASLQAAVARRLERIEFRRELRPFAPHLTLGRIKEGGTRADRERIAGARLEPAGGCTIDHVTLYRSRLSPRGPTCMPLASTPLVGPPLSSPRAGAMTQAVPILVGYLFGSIPSPCWYRAGSPALMSAAPEAATWAARAMLADEWRGHGAAGHGARHGEGRRIVLLADRWSAAASTPAVAGLAAIWTRIPDLAAVPRRQGCGDGLRRVRRADAVGRAAGVRAVRRDRVGHPLRLARQPGGRAGLGPIAYALAAPPASWLAAAGAAILIVFRHRSNVARLRAGTERRIGQRVRS